jgi:dihydroorotate dehydrogenase electron transfer subunit
MARSYKKNVVITDKAQLSEGIFSMWVRDVEITADAKPGQFLSLYCKSGNRLLPRPISICEINNVKGELRLVYRVAGQGTEEIAGYQVGDSIGVMGPLGNGFPLEEKKVILIGGGIGIPPMLELAKQIPGEKNIVLGYRDTTFLNEEFLPYGNLYIATEDGSIGTKGNVLDAIRENGLVGELIYACGPTPMLKGIQAYGIDKGIKTYLSLEERMACGIGACLACVCKTKEKDHHTNVNNTRICKDGPVFSGEEIEL